MEDNFAILGSNGVVANVTQSGLLFNPNPTNPTDQSANTTGFLDFVFAPGGTLQRNFFRGAGFGLFATQKRDRYEFAARLQNILSRHTVKYGVEAFRNKYDLNEASTGPTRTFTPAVPGLTLQTPDNLSVQGYRVQFNAFDVCAIRGGNAVVCQDSSTFARVNQLFTSGRLPAAITSVSNATITSAEANNNPFLIRLGTRVRDFQLHAKVHTNVESFYVQDDFKPIRNFQINGGLRWDYQQAYGNGGATYIKLNSFLRNLQPRVGFTWDPTKVGKGKIFANFARYVETPIPLDAIVRSGGGDTQTDKNFNVSVYNAGPGAQVVPGIRGNLSVGAVNLGASQTPVDPGLRPQTVNEVTAGGEYEVRKNLVVGVRGIYRSQGSVIEDGSFDDGNTYFIFNPGERRPGTTEALACEQPTGCFGRARRYYRALEFTGTKRFTNNYQFIASYVYSSLIGNYEGLFRNDNGQADPNITSLFDLVSLLTNQYGRLPNDRPHQFKFNGSYQTPWKLMVSGNFYAQSGSPFNQLIPHPVYGNNEGFGVPRGTATVPFTGGTVIGGSDGVSKAVGKHRSPFSRQLDLGAYYPIALGENKQLRFQVDWFNVFNDQRALSLDQTFTINSEITGVPPVPNPFYGSGLIFQYPSAFRLGAKFQF
jgi:hypothetical protein